MPLIMLVDDNTNYREGLVEVLEVMGYSVIQALNGADALSLIEQTKPDLILSVEKMPVRTGLELLEAVRGEKELKTILFVLLTGLNNRDFINMPHKLGADAIISKPIMLDELESILDNLLN